jgi:Acetyltransferases, including N-acetylases of ribosomal proteins
MSLHLKRACKKDMMLIYHWANETSVRQSSFDSRRISLSGHKAWFENVLNSDDIIQYIMYENDIPVGQVRIESKEKIGKVSYSIDKEYRGNGYGEMIISLLEKEIMLQKLSINCLIAEVLYSNTASQQIFEKLGYIKTNYDNRLEYSKKIAL